MNDLPPNTSGYQSTDVPTTYSARTPMGSTVEPSPGVSVLNMHFNRESLDIPVWNNVFRARTIFGKYGTALEHFTDPTGICFTNQHGNTLIHVSDKRQSRVITFKLDGNLQSVFTISGKIGGITSNLVDTLYIATQHDVYKEALVISYDLQGKPLQKFGRMFAFEKSDGVAVSTDGYVYTSCV